MHYRSRALTKVEADFGELDGKSLGVANPSTRYTTLLIETCPLARHLSKLGETNFKVLYESGSNTPSDYAFRRPTKARAYRRKRVSGGRSIPTSSRVVIGLTVLWSVNEITELYFCQTPDLGLGLGVDFTFPNNNKKNNPHLIFPEGKVLGV